MRWTIVLMGSAVAVAVAVGLPACGSDMFSAAGDAGDTGDTGNTGDAGDSGDTGGFCGGQCGPGFHCEFDTCVPNVAPPVETGAGRSPLSAGRYVFTLRVDTRRLIRIDSISLDVDAFAAGLSPMDLGVVGSRELTVLLDGFDLVEVLDHRVDPPTSAAWTTARALSHIALSPSGEHAILYFDWDDPRAQERQSDPGNINQVSVLYLGDADTSFADDDARLVNVAVGFLPRDVRFSADGTRAVIVSRNILTPIDLGDPAAGPLATPQAQVQFDETATEILIDDRGEFAVLRQNESATVDVFELATETHSCFEAAAAVLDIALSPSGELLLLARSDLEPNEAGLSILDVGAALDPCLPVASDVALSDVTRVVIEPHGDLAVAYKPDLDFEDIWQIDLGTGSANIIRLEKAVNAIAFASDGRYALASHLKAAGTPAWDPLIEDPEVSVDKSYGVTWLDLEANSHRLEVSNHQFGNFTFIPAIDGAPAATLQAIQNEGEPQLLRVKHALGFDDLRIDLAAIPLDLGYLPETSRAYVSQDHPWGRVTFLGTDGDDLRHVTGFALEVQ